MTKACQQLFQVNKNPSDTEIEQAFRLQVQNDYPKKIQELNDSDGWADMWNTGYSIVFFYYV